ncbi:MAG: glycosyltransferase family 4 protein [Kordiimonadaceae bacterium]|nr:glycosyltransferase family 4 protein [Kordiimonadaceae bacterium]
MAHKVKCLLVTPHYFPLCGGALTVYDALAAEAGGAIEVLTASTNYLDGKEVAGWQAFDAKASYPIHRLPALRPTNGGQASTIAHAVVHAYSDWQFNKGLLQQVIQKIDEIGVDILCTGSLDSLGWLGAAVQRLRPVKTLVYVHGEEVSQKAYSYRAERRRRSALQGADAIVAVSSFTAGLVHSKYAVAERKITLIPNGVDIARFNGAVNPDVIGSLGLPAEGYILAFGRLVARKGFDRLLSAWPLVLAEMPEAKLVIGGEGPLEQALKDTLKRDQLSGSVTMLGWIDAEALPSVYGAADLFVMPNRTLPDGDTEGFGLVLLEAASMGVTSLGGKAGGTTEAVIDGITGLLLDGNDVQKIAAGILRLMQDVPLRAKLGVAAHKHARANGWAQKTQLFLSVLEGLHKQAS